MSKSLNRVKLALSQAGMGSEILEMTGATRTALDAAREAGCEVDQIAKSIVFAGQTSGALYLFITAGSNQVNPEKASQVAGEPLGRAGADDIRRVTGFAIGGVAPLGHLTPMRAFWDPRLSDFARIYAAAGTPHHIFPASPADLITAANAQVFDFTS
jgi:prolyl-tRNA editing enzyme YbaK/EbsC (Cys-tRNA(Pro) deacylase)